MEGAAWRRSTCDARDPARQRLGHPHARRRGRLGPWRGIGAFQPRELGTLDPAGYPRRVRRRPTGRQLGPAPRFAASLVLFHNVCGGWGMTNHDLTFLHAVPMVTWETRVVDPRSLSLVVYALAAHTSRRTAHHLPFLHHSCSSCASALRVLVQRRSCAAHPCMCARVKQCECSMQPEGFVVFLTARDCHAGQISVEAEGPAPQLLLVRDLRCTPAHARAAPAADIPAPSSAGRTEHGSAPAAAASHAQAPPAALGQAPSTASREEQGHGQALAGSRAGGPESGAAAVEPPVEPGSLLLSWQAPERCTRCEVWGRREPGPPDLQEPASMAAAGGRHRADADARGGGPASAADPAQHPFAQADGGDTSSRMRSSEHSVQPHADRAHEQGPVESEQPDRPGGGASPAAGSGLEERENTSCDGWIWLGTAHAQRFWVASTLLDPGAGGVELAVQARDGAGCALPLAACPRVRAPVV